VLVLVTATEPAEGLAAALGIDRPFRAQAAQVQRVRVLMAVIALLLTVRRVAAVLVELRLAGQVAQTTPEALDWQVTSLALPLQGQRVDWGMVQPPPAHQAALILETVVLAAMPQHLPVAQAAPVL
jgi:hypothetical protein